MIKIETKTMSKAIEKAKTVHPRVRVISATDRTYSVTGSKGDNYTVKFAVANGHRLAECDCPARGLCYHIAAAAQVNVMTQSMRQAAPPVSTVKISNLINLLNLRADELNKPHNGEIGNQWRSLEYSEVQHLVGKDELRKLRFEEPITLAEEAPPWTVFFPSIHNYKVADVATFDQIASTPIIKPQPTGTYYEGWSI